MFNKTTELGQRAAADNRSNIFVWGDNSKGQLGFESEVQRVLVSDPVAVQLSQVTSIVSVSCGRAHSLITTVQGAILAMGDNTFGQLGMPSCE